MMSIVRFGDKDGIAVGPLYAHSALTIWEH